MSGYIFTNKLKREPFLPLPLGRGFKTPHNNWDIIHTPGHTDDHIALYHQENKWIFGANSYVQAKSKSMFSLSHF